MPPASIASASASASGSRNDSPVGRDAEGERIAAYVRAGKAQGLVARPKEVERVLLGEVMKKRDVD